MNKQMKILLTTLCLCCMILVASVVLFIAGVFNVGVFIALAIVELVAITFLILNIVKRNKISKRSKLKEQDMKYRVTGNKETDIYNLLGIPIQYNEDGSIKDIYEVLRITPIYDEKGNRILTPYEILGIVPEFDEKGEEVPSVFVIKNRVGQIAKVDLSSRTLSRKLSTQEKEEIFIKETLKQKLDEAEQVGDKQRVEVIKKAIEQTSASQPNKNVGSSAGSAKGDKPASAKSKAASSSSSSSGSSAKFGVAKSGKNVVKNGSVQNIGTRNYSHPFTNLIKEVFSEVEKKTSQPEKAVQKQTEPARTEPDVSKNKPVAPTMQQSIKQSDLSNQNQPVIQNVVKQPSVAPAAVAPVVKPQEVIMDKPKPVDRPVLGKQVVNDLKVGPGQTVTSFKVAEAEKKAEEDAKKHRVSRIYSEYNIEFEEQDFLSSTEMKL